MYEISAMILGVYPDADGFASVRVAPVLPPHGFCAEGRVPVPGGYVDVYVSRKDGKMSLAVRASRKMPLSVKLPEGEWKNVYASEYFAEAEV